MRSYVLVKDLVIPAGTVFGPAPTKTERHSAHVEALEALGPDNVISVTVPVEDDEHFNDLFKVLRGG